MYAYFEVKTVLAGLLERACNACGFSVSLEEAEASVCDAREGFGDFASTLAFDLAKKKKTNPVQLAKTITEHVGEHEWVETAKHDGPYLNFVLSEALYSRVLAQVLECSICFGSNASSKRKVIVEFPSVNPNKPWHAGHLRNAILGDCVARVLSFAGDKVERLDYIDDLGLQVAESVWGFERLNDKIAGKTAGKRVPSGASESSAGFVGKFDHWLGAEYVEVTKRMEEDKQVALQVREVLKSLEEGTSKTAKLGRELCEKCVRAQYETAFSLGIFHDALVWESDIVRSKLFENGLKKMLATGGVLKESTGDNAGCIVAKLSALEEFKDMKSPDKVLVRSDGTAMYTGKDVAFQLWKFGLVDAELKFSKFSTQPNNSELFMSTSSGERKQFGKADVVVNVIGVEQAYPQKVVAEILKRMGFEQQASNSIHLAYEHVVLPEGRFSGRQGTWKGFTADELIDEAKKRAKEQIREKFKDLSEKEKEQIASVVGVGAIRFSFARVSPEKKILFEWEKALSFEGDSAPYIQYMHARASRIIEKTGTNDKIQNFVLFVNENRSSNLQYNEEKTSQSESKTTRSSAPTSNTFHFTHAEERKLAKLLARFPFIVQQAAKQYRPHVIADYSLEVATQFGKFYNECQVLQEKNEKTKTTRLALVHATKTVLHNALELLGVTAPERM
ncbi:arginine--tRNA ligase [Candidatus Micrarchaeota archaeon]|nr:arginine--tRNA ligase [Candidatus Micrarchaeota archaeon]